MSQRCERKIAQCKTAKCESHSLALRFATARAASDEIDKAAIDVLFAVGLNRDVFPRVRREDPLLGEDARQALEPLLPAIPLRARSRDEERYLFAQLVSSVDAEWVVGCRAPRSLVTR